MKKNKLFVVTFALPLVFGLSGCSVQTEGETSAIPTHIQTVIDQFNAGGYECLTPSVYLKNGNIAVETDAQPDSLTCNESDSNVLGDKFNIFKSASEAFTYYSANCYDRRGGWFMSDFMLSPVVAMDSFERTQEQADQFAAMLGVASAVEIGSACDYLDITW